VGRLRLGRGARVDFVVAGRAAWGIGCVQVVCLGNSSSSSSSRQQRRTFCRSLMKAKIQTAEITATTPAPVIASWPAPASATGMKTPARRRGPANRFEEFGGSMCAERGGGGGQRGSLVRVVVAAVEAASAASAAVGARRQQRRPQPAPVRSLLDRHQRPTKCGRKANHQRGRVWSARAAGRPGAA